MKEIGANIYKLNISWYLDISPAFDTLDGGDIRYIAGCYGFHSRKRLPTIFGLLERMTGFRKHLAKGFLFFSSIWFAGKDDVI